MIHVSVGKIATTLTKSKLEPTDLEEFFSANIENLVKDEC